MSILADEVIRTARDEYNKWKSSARLYAGIAKFLRPVLIIATSIIAAKETLGQYYTGDYWKYLTGMSSGWFFPVLSVIAAAGTGIEAWLKPQRSPQIRPMVVT
jgi:hypothetical protein